MKILVINAGSSSLKYQLIDMATEKYLAKGLCEKIGIGGYITHQTNDNRKYEKEEEFVTYKQAFDKVTELLLDKKYGVISSIDEVAAVGHRIVQGADRFSKSVKVTKKVIDDIEEIADLAPLHNPANIIGIKACLEVLGENKPNVVVFDTAFHSKMPKKAHVFGIPYEYYEKYHIRRYGFHGTSHRYVSMECAKLMNKDFKDLKIVTCHLGNGASIAAVDGGRSVDTSMGFTPLDGLLMGTRCGSIDPSILPYIAEKENMSMKDIDNMMNKKSGYLGISGIGSDCRDILSASCSGNERAALALDIQNYQIKKYIGAYAAAMNGLDAVVFTGGIGERSKETRKESCENMSFFGIDIDEDRNNMVKDEPALISGDKSKVKVFVIPTNEELVIARETLDVLSLKD